METPRTDALLLGLYGTDRVEAEKIVNEFARQLERELIQASGVAARAKSDKEDAVRVANSALGDLKEALSCPRPQVVGKHACKNRKQCWEPCGDLGHHEEYALKREPQA